MIENPVTLQDQLSNAREMNSILQDQYNAQAAKLREAQSANRDLEAQLRVQKFYLKTAREGLEFYKPGPFWDTVTALTKAAEDKGTHAAYSLRTIDPDSPESA